MGRRVELDLERFARLEEVLGAELGEIIESIVDNLSEQIVQVEEALAAGQLEPATQAAHLCRNDALMVGARPLLEALSEVESATRSNQLGPARQALERLQEIWPSTRSELERIARDPGSTERLARDPGTS
jgi:HPt (histidine-containing phosphotransfer) domain-containing protein